MKTKYIQCKNIHKNKYLQESYNNNFYQLYLYSYNSLYM